MNLWPSIQCVYISWPVGGFLKLCCAPNPVGQDTTRVGHITSRMGRGTRFLAKWLNLYALMTHGRPSKPQALAGLPFVLCPAFLAVAFVL